MLKGESDRPLPACGMRNHEVCDFSVGASLWGFDDDGNMGKSSSSKPCNRIINAQETSIDHGSDMKW